MLLPGQPRYAWPPTITPKWVKSEGGSALAIDLDVVKSFLNIPLEDTHWDQQLAGFVRTAQLAVEKVAQLSITPAIWIGTLPAFADQIRIDRRPFISVSKIEYVAPDTGTITEVDAATYHALPIAQACGMVFLGDGCAWPEAARRFDAVRLTVTAGFDPIPEEITHALLMTVAAIDRMRGDEGSSSGSNVSVYAMKTARGASLVPAEARDLIGSHILRSI